MWSDSVSYYFRQFHMSVLDKRSGVYLGGGQLEIRNIFECLHKMDKVLYTAFLRECEGSYRNYAAASDILRLFVLHEYGGLYLDVDVTLARCGCNTGGSGVHSGLHQEPLWFCGIRYDRFDLFSECGHCSVKGTPMAQIDAK
ncbi:hypothetical protein F7414_22520 [Salmonella enterica]|nr:hypothetical protein [Salmonella enterica]